MCRKRQDASSATHFSKNKQGCGLFIIPIGAPTIKLCNLIIKSTHSYLFQLEFPKNQFVQRVGVGFLFASCADDLMTSDVTGGL
jgi:hypothetical protein